MFSLIITIISIALVTALALATIYYGGSAFKQGQADASASKAVLQSQQLLGASELFYANLGRWPTDINEMVTLNFLQSAPVASAGSPGGLMAEAMAASGTWSMPTPNEPTFVLTYAGLDLACKSVNKKSVGLDGILKVAYTNYPTQCFGDASGNLTIVASKNPGNLAAVLTAARVSAGAPSGSKTGAEWFATPKADATVVAAVTPVVPPVVTPVVTPVVAPVATGTTPVSLGYFGLPNVNPYSYSGGALALTPPSSPSTGAFTYVSSNTSVATISGATMTVVGVGSFQITATQAADSTYAAASTSSFGSFRGLDAMAMGGDYTKTFGDAPFAVSMTSNNPAPMTFSLYNGPVSVSGNTVTILAAGRGAIRATQPASGLYSAVNAIISITVNPSMAQASLNMGTLVVPAFTHTGSAAFTLTNPTSNSPAPWTYYSSDSTVLSVSGNKVTPGINGAATIYAVQAAVTGYAAGSVSAYGEVWDKNGISLNVDAFGLTVGSVVTLNATGRGTGAITYTSSNTAVATISGNQMTVTGLGSAQINAAQAADAVWNATSTNDPMAGGRGAYISIR